MKYSEFLLRVAENITQDNYYLCVILTYNNIAKQHPEYVEKLQRTIKRKLASLPKMSDGSSRTTLASCVFRARQSNVEYRVNWLKSLAAIHAKKGN